MTKEEKAAAIKAECARLGRPNARTKADLESLLLAVIADRDGKDAPQLSAEPPKKTAGKPPKLTWLSALLLSDIVTKLKAERVSKRNPERKMSETEACEEICGKKGRGLERSQLIGSSGTLRRKIYELTKHRDKHIKDEEFRTKLLHERDRFLIVAEASAEEAANIKMRRICEVVDEYLGEKTSEAVISANEVVEKN